MLLRNKISAEGGSQPKADEPRVHASGGKNIIEKIIERIKKLFQRKKQEEEENEEKKEGEEDKNFPKDKKIFPF